MPKNARRLTWFDESVIHLYAKGLSTRDIQDHLREIYSAMAVYCARLRHG